MFHPESVSIQYEKATSNPPKNKFHVADGDFCLRYVRAKQSIGTCPKVDVSNDCDELINHFVCQHFDYIQFVLCCFVAVWYCKHCVNGWFFFTSIPPRHSTNRMQTSLLLISLISYRRNVYICGSASKNFTQFTRAMPNGVGIFRKRFFGWQLIILFSRFFGHSCVWLVDFVVGGTLNHAETCNFSCFLTHNAHIHGLTC